MSDLYISRLAALMERASETNADALDQAAGRFADSLAGGGLVHLYGSGHSVPCFDATNSANGSALRSMTTTYGYR